ncbi:MAG: DEAD/DEAH box helicase [Crocinitomicaceae bacterium]|nr:DEAD/DEAH box helicase [Crocinitomicaceae bacterium]
MLENKLLTYISNHAQFVVISRSHVYAPKLVGHHQNVYEFTCQGSEKQPYDVKIDIQDLNRIKTSCNCPYEGHGICKHQVAAVNELIHVLKNKLINPTEELKMEKVSTTTFIPNDKGVINKTELNKIDFQDIRHFYSPLHFSFMSRNVVEGSYNDYRDINRISLKYNKITSQMALECSCKSRFPCFHKSIFIEAFLKSFGTEYFMDDYEERIKKRLLHEKGYTGILNFDDLFELSISTSGIKIEEKIKNIVGIEDLASQFYQADRKQFFLPSKAEKPIAYGVAICLLVDKNEALEIYPFYGKLDKTKSKLATKFRIISEMNFSEALSDVADEKKLNFITTGIQLSSLYHEATYRTFKIEHVKKLIHLFSAIQDDLQAESLFIHDRRKTFVRANIQEINVVQETVVPVLKITEKKPFYQLDFKIKIGQKSYNIHSSKITILPFGVILDQVLYPILNPEVGFSLLKALEKPQLNILQTNLESFADKVIEPFSRVFEIDFADLKSFNKKKKSVEKATLERHVYLSDEEGEYIVFQPLLKYGDELVTPESTEKIWEDKTKLSYRERDEILENEFITSFRNLHPKFKNQTDYFYLSVEEAMESLNLMEIIDQLHKNEIRVFGLDNLKSIRYNLNKPTFSIGLSSGTDWFDMKIDIQFGNQTVDLKQVQKSILKESNYVELKDGTLGLLPKEWIDKYKKYFKLGQIKKDHIEISNFQFNIIDELYEQETNTPKFLTELYEKKKRLNNLQDLKSIPKPKHIQATLRPYQKEGLNWLVFLHENQLGGCLADDMGLGKTLQTIVFLQYLKNLNPKEKGLPHLVIAPTSLMFNWMDELKKFAPTLKVLDYIGPNRGDLFKNIDDYDIVLTTYGSIVKDVEKHAKREYNYIILDESQAIKNPQSQRFKTVRLLKGKNRLALTGTPIENNTFDLYSQFSFLNPGIFGSIKHFKSTFSEEIDKNQDQETSDLLARMIHPFILRRTKEQVATELPSKTEAVIYCEMGKEQRKVYDHFKNYFQQKLKEQIEQEGINRSQVYILQGLTKLRQICNSSALADNEKDYGQDSTKLDELVRHLTEKVNNHKILVFSQFVGMLQLVKERLENEGILFEYLDGQTKDREEKVNNFQNNPAIHVFLISLKAGGTGLNLTEADYVYLIDPWWNPAVESQAIDRCYRIGQDKKVMAYRMICKDTIEEKIVQLQDKKKTVASDIIRIDTEKKSFNKKDVALFFGE